MKSGFLTLSDLLLLLVIFFVLLFGLTWQQQSRPAAVNPPAAEAAPTEPLPPTQQPEASLPDPRIADLPAQKKSRKIWNRRCPTLWA